MITEILCQCSVDGPEFNPSLVDVGGTITVRKMQIRGGLIDFGRFKGELSDEGVLLIDGPIAAVLDFMEREKFPEQGCDISISILVAWQDQCNFELSANELEKLSKLKVTLGITCYEAPKVV